MEMEKIIRLSFIVCCLLFVVEDRKIEGLVFYIDSCSKAINGGSWFFCAE